MKGRTCSISLHIADFWRKIKEKFRIGSKRSAIGLIIVFFVFIATIVGIIITTQNNEGKESDIAMDFNNIYDEQEVVVDNNSGLNIDGNKKEDKENLFIVPQKGERPYAVNIDNEGDKCIPQGGIDRAQIIYEIIVEGGETRFMALFWGTDPEMVGPVRSTRHYFLDYVLEHDAIHVHFGWSPKAINDIYKLKINNINGVANGGEIFWDITNDANNWQDSYTSMAKIRKYAESVKYRTTTDKEPVFLYNGEDVEIPDGINAETVKLYYSQYNTCEYAYDYTFGNYIRFRKGKSHIERVTGRQLRAKNIIIQFVNNYTIPGDTEGRQEVETVGNGDGWFITLGKAEKIKWSKESRSEPTKYMDENGDQIMLNPGQTWIQIISPYSKVEMQ